MIAVIKAEGRDKEGYVLEVELALYDGIRKPRFASGSEADRARAMSEARLKFDKLFEFDYECEFVRWDPQFA